MNRQPFFINGIILVVLGTVISFDQPEESSLRMVTGIIMLVLAIIFLTIGQALPKRPQ